MDCEQLEDWGWCTAQVHPELWRASSTALAAFDEEGKELEAPLGVVDAKAKYGGELWQSRDEPPPEEE